MTQFAMLKAGVPACATGFSSLLSLVIALEEFVLAVIDISFKIYNELTAEIKLTEYIN